MAVLKKISHYKLFTQYWGLFFKSAFSSEGLGSRDGRLLIWGKIRRMFIGLIPPLARALQRKYGIQGGCAQCGTSCKLLFTCPALDTKTSNCTAYDARPQVCRLFPITPADIRDRDIAQKKVGCGFTFDKTPQKKEDAPILQKAVQGVDPVSSDQTKQVA